MSFSLRAEKLEENASGGPAASSWQHVTVIDGYTAYTKEKYKSPTSKVRNHRYTNAIDV